MIDEKEARRLLEENERLKKRIKELEADKHRIEEQKKQIVDEKRKIEQEFEEFKAKHAGTVENLRKALRIKKDIKTSPNPIGAQKGHAGHGRESPDQPDREEDVSLDECPDCHTHLDGKILGKRLRMVMSIHILNPFETIGYWVHRKWCPNCKKPVEPDIPGVLPHARFNLNIMLLVMYLHLALRVPVTKVCEYFQQIHGLHISEGEIPHILTQLAREFGDHYTHLEKLVRLARVKHTDSTSWRINGKNYAAWVFIAAGVVLYKIHKSTSHKTPLCVLGKNGEGITLVVDRHSAYRTLVRKAGYSLQYCWSHILEDSKELRQTFGREGTYVHKRLKEIYANAKALNHHATPEQLDQLRGEIIQLTNRHYTHGTIRRFVNNLALRDLNNLFRFTTDPLIEPTNNISERELRHLVMIRRISHGSRSKRGATVTAQLLSTLQTLKFNKQNVLQGLQDILESTTTY